MVFLVRDLMSQYKDVFIDWDLYVTLYKGILQMP